MNMNVMLQAPAAGMDSSMMWIMLILMMVFIQKRLLIIF